MAEGVGFEPTVGISHDSFQDCSDKPL